MKRFIGLSMEEAMELAEALGLGYDVVDDELQIEDPAHECPFYEFNYDEDGKICEYEACAYL